MIYRQPLEQFEIFNIVTFGQTFSSFFTNMFFFMNVTFLVIVIFFFKVSQNKLKLIPSAWQQVYELIYLFVLDTLKAQVDPKGIKFFPYIFTIFIFILISNLIGLIPFAFTVTSNIFITFTMGFSTWIGLTILGFMNQKLKFLKLFLPSGVPLPLIPMLVVIETVSYVSRAFSLSIRLFANLMSGHTLLHILAFFSSKLLKLKLIIGILALTLVIAITMLEVGIAFLQAYVFMVLICIYLNDSYHAEH
jgi:ATP synthase subunit 6